MADVLDPKTEFDEPVVDPVVEPVVKDAPVGASVEELAELRGQLSASLKQIEALQSDTAVVGKLKELFTGKPDDPKDAFVRSEIRRLVPDLDDVVKIKQVLPYILNALNLDAESKIEERTETAQDVMKGLMSEVGLDATSDKAVGYMEEALAREIKENPDLLKQWNRGNVKSAVTKAFEAVSQQLFAPVRLKTKRGAVREISETPKPTVRGGPAAPAPSGDKAKLDFKDTSRDNVNKIHDAAFARLQELMEE